MQTANTSMTDPIEDFNVERLVKQAQNKRLKRMQELASKDEFLIGGKTYRRRKITAGQHEQLDTLRAEWQSLQTTDAKLAAQKFAKIYEKGAEFYLGMTAKIFYDCDWEEIREIIDGCNFRTEYGSFL